MPERVSFYSLRHAGRVVGRLLEFLELRPCLVSPARLLVAWEAK